MTNRETRDSCVRNSTFGIRHFQIGAKKNPFSSVEKRCGQTISLSPHLPQSTRSELDLAPVAGAACSYRLPWRLRASPSATHDEFVGINECGYIDASSCNVSNGFSEGTGDESIALSFRYPEEAVITQNYPEIRGL